MNLSEIETFLMIVKTKNITKTAENLFLSQPTVSHRLKSLEDELEVKLMTRKKGYKQIELTTGGGIYPYCRTMGIHLAGNAACKGQSGEIISDGGMYRYAEQCYII